MAGRFLLGSWLVEPSLNTVSSNGNTIRLEPKVMEVLVCLAEHTGEAVSKEKLLQTVWSDTFVSESVLTRSISELRRVFEDEAREPRVIQTIAKRGYRLMIPVVPVNGATTGSSPLSLPTELRTEDARADKKHRRWLRSVLVGSAVLVLVVLAANAGRVRDYLRWRGAPPIRSLAVLPLRSLSNDPNQEYFADGLTEELITELSRLNGLKVISRTSVMRYQKTDKSLPDIARELNVEAIVEGSVLRSGDRVRITAQLISARTDANLWAETYDRSLEDALTVQAAVATAIADKIKTNITPGAAIQERAKRVNLRAHEAYLLGLHEINLASEVSNHEGMRPAAEEHLRRAVKYYQQAIKEDPNYATAYLGLADAENPNDVEANARKALELDDTLAEAHVELGAVLLTRDLDWKGAERELLRAIEVNPSYAPAHQSYGYYLDAVGRLDEGLKEYHRAQELDPANDHLGAALYSRRDYGPLIELQRRALATNPPGDNTANAIAHKVLIVAYARTGKRKESIEEMRSAVACMGFHDFAEEIRRGYVAGGYQGAMHAYLSGAKRTDWVFHWVDIYAYAELGDYDEAFARLSELNKTDPDLWQWIGSDADGFGIQGVPNLTGLRIEPMWDPLHSDPRFEKLAHQLGLPAESDNRPKH